MSESFGPDCINSTAAHGIEHCLLGMSGFRPDSHVAQQSRRDRLRFQQVQVPPATTNLLDLPHDGRNCGAFYDQSMYSSGLMLDFSSGANAGGAISSLSQNPIICSNISAAAAAVAAEVGHEQQNSSLWKGLGSQPHSSVWATNYGGFQDLSTQVSNPSGALLSHDSQRQYGEQPCVSLPFYSNALHGVAASSPSAVAAPEIEMASLVQQVPQPNPWMEGVNELALLPSFNPSRIGNAAVWMTRDTQQWGHTNETLGRSNSVNGEFAATQGLSLSLSSNPPPELPVVPFEAKFGPVGFPSTATGFSRTLQSPKPNDAVSICSYSGYSSGSRNPGNSVQCNGRSSAEEHRGVGPLGPFTGYATILKSSKYLKPAQLLLDESCSAATGREPSKPFESPQTLASAVPVATYCAVFTGDNDVHRRSGNSGASSSSLHSSNGGSGEAGGVSEGGDQLHHPQIQQKKAKLLFMQGEVCRRYKQYNQQMQMAISSFESVAGLSSAIPFLSLALKTVSKHFRFLKSLISEQLLNISRALGEEFISSAGSGRTDSATAPRLKFLDETLRKQKEEENGLGFFENNQPIWRPQRGLPEKSVAVLRAWLFDHFLHPYPTDTDKLMLANQTGLSRNQVSNWFINARVRVWKPMVEEIHMLETKGLSEVDLNSSKYDGTTSAVNSQPVENQQEHQSSMPSDCSSVGLASNVEDCRNMGQWHPEKRSRMEHYAIADSLEGGLAGLAPYQNGFDMGGLGGVSLTLGLRQEDTHYQQQQQQMRPYFGSHMVHDFVG